MKKYLKASIKLLAIWNIIAHCMGYGFSFSTHFIYYEINQINGTGKKCVLYFLQLFKEIVYIFFLSVFFINTKKATTKIK